MKTITLLFAAILLTFNTGFAQIKSTSVKQPSIAQLIQQNLRVPENMKGSVATERVRLVFTFDENGKAHVTDIVSARPDIHDSVISQFEAIDFSKSDKKTGETYSIWLTFSVL
jgi:hypothetical protein